ncbi:MAG: hypothetical protein KME31_25890 [Tolypothrix carrinoi HA7290-LM1]|nr:hypothetical protein [Tolypothrix carrinoi HA7290-LM1]
MKKRGKGTRGDGCGDKGRRVWGDGCGDKGRRVWGQGGQGIKSFFHYRLPITDYPLPITDYPLPNACKVKVIALYFE